MAGWSGEEVARRWLRLKRSELELQDEAMAEQIAEFVAERMEQSGGTSSDIPPVFERLGVTASQWEHAVTVTSRRFARELDIMAIRCSFSPALASTMLQSQLGRLEFFVSWPRTTLPAMQPIRFSCRTSQVLVSVAAWFAAFVALSAGWASAQAPKKVQFETDVAPILKERCWKCHAGAEPKAGLKLTQRGEILRGGKSGPAIRIAAAESSLLWEKIASNEMPAGGPPLTAAEKGVLRAWINDGALGADAGPAPGTDETEGTNQAQPVDFWSFKPPVRAAAPAVVGIERARSAIDAWILESLEAKQLGLSPEAPLETLLRRAYFSLIGLPPSPDEVQAFLTDDDPAAYERVIDRLLASPSYGERWGRHWLDVAGYADSAGVLAEDRQLPTAFRYRDYVIRALNSDKPYDRFLQEQIAGDELTNYWQSYATLDRLPEEVVEGITATGYLRCAADSSRPDFSTIKNADAQYFYPTLNDTLQIFASSTLGLTLQCARCHSHKYDPIPQSEYYRLQAVFMAALRPSQWIPQMDRQLAVATASQKKLADERARQVDAEVARLKAEQAQQRQQFQQQLFQQRLATLPEPIREDVRRAVEKTQGRSEVEQYLASKFGEFLQPKTEALDKLLPEMFADYRAATEQRNAAIAAQERQRIHFDQIRALYDLPGPVVTPVLRRGDALTPGAAVEPGVLTAIQTSQPFTWTAPAADAKTSGRRLALARWLTQPEHPLTARVFVNRVWLHHFGEGIVATPEDFGAIGSPPSHPRLLDWLARELVERGWSVKHLQRAIVTSSVYRQRSTLDESAHQAALAADPDNRLLWRQRLRRLDAEAVRDAMLSVSGTLDRRQFGAPTAVSRRPDGEVAVPDVANDRRRSIYLQVLRSQPVTLLQQFDQPVMETNCTRRSRSTVSTQALTLLNGDFTQTRALALAERVQREFAESLAAGAVSITFSRQAASDEVAACTQFIETQLARHVMLGANPEVARRQALADLCHMLLTANEFVYAD